ncbi:MAG TPA: hypothetical protein VFK80_06080 [Limnochordia bacterium]|nr:hypothetical protein [Limnochordia bacterium]
MANFSADRLKALRRVWMLTTTEEWDEALRGWYRAWEASYEALRDIDPTDTAGIIRHQERIKLIESMVQTNAHHVADYEKARREGVAYD